jgi:hypothetical protein
MPRRLLGRTLLVLGLLSALAGYAVLVLRGTVLDGSATTAGARAALAEPALRTELAARTADATVSTLVGAEQVAALHARGIDVRADAATVASSLLDTPAFVAAYDTAVGQVHERVLHDPKVVPRLDLTGLVAVAREELVRTNSIYAAVVAVDRPLVVTLPTGELPDLTGVDRTFSSARAAVAVLSGIAASVGGLVLTPPDRRRRRLRQVGTLLVAVGLVQLSGSYATHLVLERAGGTTAAVARALLQPVLGRLALPGFVPLAIGALTVAVAHRRTGRPADHGRAAFLTDPSGRPTEWRFDAAFEPETLRTAPTALAHRH